MKSDRYPAPKNAAPLFIFGLPGVLKDHGAVNEPLARIYRSLVKNGADVWIWTGLPATELYSVRDWLLTHNLFPDHLVLRGSGETGTDAEIKMRWFGALTALNAQRLVGAFECDSATVATWRAAGVTCLQVAA